MKLSKSLAATLVMLAACLPHACPAAVEYLKEEPPKGSVPHGKVVYVDDGTCPKGMVKQVTGGNRSKSIPRKVRCVKRPD